MAYRSDAKSEREPGATGRTPVLISGAATTCYEPVRSVSRTFSTQLCFSPLTEQDRNYADFAASHTSTPAQRGIAPRISSRLAQVCGLSERRSEQSLATVVGTRDLKTLLNARKHREGSIQ